jgi:hypothetical protein
LLKFSTLVLEISVNYEQRLWDATYGQSVSARNLSRVHLLHKRSPHSANLRKRVPETPPLSLEEALGRVLVLVKRGMSSARNLIETVFRFDETIFGVEL